MNRAFLDYDFTRDPRYLRGYHPAQIDTSKFAAYEDTATVYPRSAWRDMAMELKAAGGGLSQLVNWILNQLQEGSCVGNGTTQGCQILQAKQFGKERAVQMSAMSLYKRIGQSAQSGASVQDALTEMQAKGELPLDTPENKARFKHTMPATGFSNKMPDGWETTAAQFKIDEVTICKSIDEIVSANFNQEPVIVGRDGHCICYCDPVWDEQANAITEGYANSWGEWGAPLGGQPYGFGFDSMKIIGHAASWAFAIRSVTSPGFQL